MIRPKPHIISIFWTQQKCFGGSERFVWRQCGTATIASVPAQRKNSLADLPGCIGVRIRIIRHPKHRSMRVHNH